MRQLNIRNLTLSVDAEDVDAKAEAHKVIERVNTAIRKLDGMPTLLFETRVIADYESDSEEDSHA